MYRILVASSLVAILCLAAPTFAGHSVNINTADKAMLTTLTGIGDVKAQAIIDYRAANGPFVRIEDIQNVSGIGTATYNNIKDHITVDAVQVAQQVSTQDQSTPTPSASPSTPVSSYVPPPDPTIFVDAGGARVVIVGADAEFRGKAYNKSGELVENARLTWNFGDGTTQEGSVTVHHFEYPGDYVVVLSAAKGIESVSSRILVTAEPAKLSFLAEADGSVIVRNLSDRDVDLSKWVVRAFFREFVLPEHTLVLSNGSIRISPKIMGFFAGPESELAYPNGVKAFSSGERFNEQPPQQVRSPVEPSTSVSVSVAQVLRPEPPGEEVFEEPLADTVQTATLTVSQVASAAGGLGSRWWYAAGLFAAISGAAIVLIRRLQGKEWIIIEDSA